MDMEEYDDKIEVIQPILKTELEESKNFHKKKDGQLLDLVEELDRVNGLLKRKNEENLDKEKGMKSLST